MTDVERLADRIVMLHDGHVLIDSELDALRECYSLALVPHQAASREELLGLGPCLAVRERRDALHAVFELEPDKTLGLLRRDLGVQGLPCTQIALEEMFIELAGGQR